MTYISRIELNIDLSATKLAISNREILHAIVENSFLDIDNTRHLWKLDTLNGSTYLYIISSEKPNLDVITNQLSVGIENNSVIKNYDKRLSQIQKDRHFEFKLIAAPTIKKDGKILYHMTPYFQLEWLKKKSEMNGFEIINANVVRDSLVYFKKSKNKGLEKGFIREVCFKGTLEIKDAEKFKSMLVNGLGRKKAYGMGVMEVIPI